MDKCILNGPYFISCKLYEWFGTKLDIKLKLYDFEPLVPIPFCKELFFNGVKHHAINFTQQFRCQDMQNFTGQTAKT